MADASGGILEGLGHEADAAHAGEQEDAVTELLALHQEIDGKDDNDAADADGAQEAHQEFSRGLELGAMGIDDADGCGLGDGWFGGGDFVGCGGEVSADVLDGGEGVFEGFFGGQVNGSYFFLNVEAVVGEIAGDVQELAGDYVPDGRQHGEDENADDPYGDDSRNASGFEASDGRSKKKCQGKGEGKRNEEIPREVENQHDGREDEKGSDAGEFRGSRVGHTTSRGLMEAQSCRGKNTSGSGMQTRGRES